MVREDLGSGRVRDHDSESINTLRTLQGTPESEVGKPDVDFDEDRTKDFPDRHKSILTQ